MVGAESPSFTAPSSLGSEVSSPVLLAWFQGAAQIRGSISLSFWKVPARSQRTTLTGGAKQAARGQREPC